MSALYLLNTKRRGKRKTASRRTCSPAQRAATARMLAANRSSRRTRRNPSKRRAVSVASAPARRRTSRRSSRRASFSVSRMTGGGAATLLKNGAMAGAGAVGVDVLFGYAAKVLPANMATPVDSTGGTNWLYFAAKAALAVGVATAGKRFIPAKIAVAMGEGALAVMSYQIVRGMLPAGIAMGAYSPVPTMAPPSLGRMGAYATIANTGAGARAAMTANAIAGR